MTRRKASVVGILLVYYPEYFDGSVTRFWRLLRKIHNDAALVVVCNGSFAPQTPPTTSAIVLRGDNALREFSGWKVGINHCRNSAAIEADALFVLANDTFCHHNKFGPVTELAFVSAFRHMLAHPNQLAIGGELHGGTTEMRILDKPFRTWVSTYLVAITSPLLSAIDDLAVPCDMNLFFERGNAPQPFLTGPLNSALRTHVENWLFNSAGKSKWYGAGPLTAASRSHFMGKATSILLEMNLAASCAQKGGVFVSVFGNPFIRQIRRLERLLGMISIRGKRRAQTALVRHDGA